MKGKTQIFAVLSVLFLLQLQPQNSTAVQEKTRIEHYSVSSVLKIQTFNSTLKYQRVLVNDVWWIYVYDNGKLIETFPE